MKNVKKLRRLTNAMERLTVQLEKGTKTVKTTMVEEVQTGTTSSVYKGVKVQTAVMTTKQVVKMVEIPLTEQDKERIAKEIVNIKKKI